MKRKLLMRVSMMSPKSIYLLIGKVFYQEMNNLITKKVKLSEWQIFFGCMMDVDDEIDKFNRQGLYYYDRN